MSIVWLASYPKSGNTWMRVFLTNYLRNADTPADINDLEFMGIATARELFDMYAGFESSDLTHEEIDAARPSTVCWHRIVLICGSSKSMTPIRCYPMAVRCSLPT